MEICWFGYVRSSPLSDKSRLRFVHAEVDGCKTEAAGESRDGMLFTSSSPTSTVFAGDGKEITSRCGGPTNLIYRYNKKYRREKE